MKYIILVVMVILMAACSVKDQEPAKPTVVALSIVRATSTSEVSQGATSTATPIPSATQQPPQSGQNSGGSSVQSEQNAAWQEFLKTCQLRTDWTVTYIVQRGDTLVGIASRLKVSAVDLARGNCLKNPNLLSVGQVLRIPGIPTFTPTPTLISSSTPLPSVATATFTPTPGPIADFTVNPSTVKAGETFTVSWSVPENIQTGIYLRRNRVLEDGYATAMPPEDFAMLPAAGSMNFLANPYGYGEQVILIVYTVDGGRYEYSVFVAVNGGVPPQTSCNPPFFFVEAGRQYVYSGGGILNGLSFDLCPSANFASTPAIMQMFENGMMIYRADTNTIYVMPYTGLVAIFQGTYVEGETLIFPQEPGLNLVKPEGVLGKAYIEHYDVAQFLGWAVSPAESYAMTYQPTTQPIASWNGGTVMTFSNGGRFFVTTTVYGSTPPVWAYINAISP